MAVQFSPRAVFLAGSALLTLSLVGYGLRQYQRRGNESALVAFVALMSALSISLFAEIFLRVVTAPELKLLGFNFLNTVGIWLSSYSFLWFALAYSHNTRWLNRWLAGLAIVTPLCLSLIVSIQPEFLYTATGVVTQGPVVIFGITFQEWVTLDRTLKRPFFVVVLAASSIVLVGTGILGRYLLQNRGDLYTGQMAAVAIGSISPLLAVGLVLSGVFPPELSVTGVAYGVTGIGFAVGIFRYRLMRVVPVGRRELVEKIPDPVIMVDDKARVVDCNPAARELVAAPSGWRGMDTADFFAPLPDDAQQLLDTATETEISPEDSGTKRHFMPEVSAIGDNNQAPTGRLIILREITAQKQREQELSRQNEQLERFASTVSHDLRNPLNVAYAQLQLISDDVDPERFDELMKAHDRMDQLIDDLLTLAQVGQTITETEPVSLAEAATTAKAHVILNSCEVKIAVSSGTTVFADKDRLVQAFENLYRNAVEHNDSPVTIRVGVLHDTKPSDSHAQHTGFFIEDNGCGIPNEQQTDIFKHGYTTSDGTGFGLSIVDNIVTAHGWDISATESSTGGARFEITGITSETAAEYDQQTSEHHEHSE